MDVQHLKETVGKNWRQYKTAVSCFPHNRSKEMTDCIRYVESIVDKIKTAESSYDPHADWQENWLRYSHL